MKEERYELRKRSGRGREFEGGKVRGKKAKGAGGIREGE